MWSLFEAYHPLKNNKPQNHWITEETNLPVSVSGSFFQAMLFARRGRFSIIDLLLVCWNDSLFLLVSWSDLVSLTYIRSWFVYRLMRLINLLPTMILGFLPFVSAVARPQLLLRPSTSPPSLLLDLAPKLFVATYCYDYSIGLVILNYYLVLVIVCL